MPDIKMWLVLAAAVIAVASAVFSRFPVLWIAVLLVCVALLIPGR